MKRRETQKLLSADRPTSLKRLSPEAALAKAKELIASGKVVIKNDAALKGGRAVSVRSFKYKKGGGLVFEWSRPGIGFGAVTLTAENGKLRADTECMGTQFCLDVIRQAFDERDAED